MSRIAVQLRERVDGIEGIAADGFAQMVVCGLATSLLRRESLEPAATWLLAQAREWQQPAMREVFTAAGWLAGTCRWLSDEEIVLLRDAVAMFAAVGGEPGGGGSLFEPFLAYHGAEQRKRKGVYFTPREIVDYILAEVDRQLRRVFGKADGIADAYVTLLDPAAGDGAFLTAAVKLIHKRFTESYERESTSANERSQRWNDYVVQSLLPRLRGIELMPASCFLAHLNIAAALAETGFTFNEPARLEVHLGNALTGPTAEPLTGSNDECIVVIGNPPFSYLSENDSDWIKGLIRGDRGQSGYLEFDGERLGERKTWLHDDYVKFLRYAQWQVEQVGRGIVAFVTNHGYLDNATFRLLRRRLMSVFPRISVVDLHGSRKKGEVSPTGERDENVFGLDQGIAIGFFRRPSVGGERQTTMVEHAELWGSKRDKLQTLGDWLASTSDATHFQPLQPAAPDFRWIPASATTLAEYQQAIRLPELMPVYTTAPVTARDGLVVAFSEQELLARIQRFCDLSIPDEAIRREFFPTARSARYPAGDTRGWKLAEVRRRLAEESDLRPFVRRVLYRPFDWRYAFWHEAMIDWPRAEVMRHLSDWPATNEGQNNLALIARRQMLPARPCTYFWITDSLTLDGVIRSDNRGSEAVFPQRLLPRGEASASLNLDVDRIPANVSSEDVLAYSYALFHSPTYRLRYAGELHRDFPRVVWPKSNELFTSLADIGRQLIELHLFRHPATAQQVFDPPAHNAATSHTIESPQWRDGTVFLNPATPLAKASQPAWQFLVGGHQVLRKWLVDRRGRSLTAEERSTYQAIVTLVEATLELVPQIDRVVEEAGGWPDAFL